MARTKGALNKKTIEKMEREGKGDVTMENKTTTTKAMKAETETQGKTKVVKNNDVDFNPDEYRQYYEDGTPYLPFNVQLLWFRMKYPNGKIKTFRPDWSPEKEAGTYIATARVYKDTNDAEDCYLSEASAKRGPDTKIIDKEINIDPFTDCQRAALSLALRLAGFWCSLTPQKNSDEEVSENKDTSTKEEEIAKEEAPKNTRKNKKEAAPTEKTPVETTPKKEAPAEETLVETTPEKEISTEETVPEEASEKTGSEPTPKKETSTEEASTETPPTEPAPVEGTSAETATTEKTSTEETLTETASTEETSTEETLTETASTEETSTEETPSETASTEETSTEETPSETIPVEETTAENEPEEAETPITEDDLSDEEKAELKELREINFANGYYQGTIGDLEEKKLAGDELGVNLYTYLLNSPMALKRKPKEVAAAKRIAELLHKEWLTEVVD